MYDVVKVTPGTVFYRANYVKQACACAHIEVFPPRSPREQKTEIKNTHELEHVMP